MDFTYLTMKWLINPFERIAGWQALFIGIVVMVLTVIIGKINHVVFDSVLAVHAGVSLGFLSLFTIQIVDFLILFLTMWLAGLCFSKTKVRAIDVAGTMALARAPMLLVAIVCFLPVQPASSFDISRLVIFTLIYIPFVVWMVALMFKAYSVSCHLKGGRAVASFTGALVVAVIVSMSIFFFILGNLFANAPVKNLLTPNSKENVMITDSLTIRQKTEKVVKAFEQGDYEAITRYFDEAMKKALPPSGLKMAWLATNMTCGTFEKADMTNLKETCVGNHDIIEVPFHFAKEKRNLRLAFNGEGEIVGLFFLPDN